MINTKIELLKILRHTDKIKCAIIQYSKHEHKTIKKVLKLNYSEKDLLEFLTSLDYEYDDGWGGQELFGTVWLEDDSWLTRGEYDGSEWWQHNILPNIPMECLTKLEWK